MINLLNNQAEAYSIETFQCGHCERDFQAKIITWVDVSRAPQAKPALLQWKFNVIECTHCGCRHFSGSPFFYEDFENGLLVAVYPRIPEERSEVEKSIREKYGYYPVLEFFYDMTQIWMLIYFQEHYKANRNLRELSRIGTGEQRLRKILRFLKEDEMMITIREKLTESFMGDVTNDELVDLLGQAVYTLEEMRPWPLDHRCVCGADLIRDFKCCGRRVAIEDHQYLLSKHFVLYCPSCKEALSGASCESCGRVYTWKLGTVGTYKTGAGAKEAPADEELHPRAEEGMP